MKMTSHRFTATFFALLLALPACSQESQESQEYDLVINNGRVMDPETNYDKVANVGITGGKIAVITEDAITGQETIDASGLVVAPGFIDTHFHSVDPFATKLVVADGVTTGMDLEAGSAPVGEWYAQKDASGWQVNYGTTSGMIANRIFVHDPEVEITAPMDAALGRHYIDEAALDGTTGWSVTRSSIDQMNQIMSLMDEDLRQGAIGIGFGAAYMARGMSSYEQFLAQKVAANYGRLSSVHTRFHLNTETPTEAPIGLSEVLANAMALNAPLLLAHDNDYGWWENEEKLRLAREQGYNVWAEYYPYEAGSTFVSADFLRPELWEAVQGYKYEETVYDPGEDKFLTKDEYLQMVKEKPGYFVVVFLLKRQEWMKHWLTIPHMVVASDAMPGTDAEGNFLPWDADISKYAGHPRTAGSFSKTLQLARDAGVPLMFTLSQLSYWTAKHLGDTGLKSMQQRGRVQEGMVADLTLFDPVTVESRATYKVGENGLPPVGIPYVIVNGTVVVDGGEVLDVRPGQPIRFPVEEKGRFEPISPDGWLNENTISDKIVPHMDNSGAGQMVGGQKN